VEQVSQIEDIENQALRYVLKNLGDAALVEVKENTDEWHVTIYGRISNEPLGQLIYSAIGKLVVERSTPAAEMRQKAIEISRTLSESVT
jgi:hypothetical protein